MKRADKLKLVEIDIKNVPEYIRKLKQEEILRKKRMKSNQKRLPIDRQQMQRRKNQKAKTIQEQIKEFDFKGAQKEALQRVFQLLAQGSSKFSWTSIQRVLSNIGTRLRRKQIQLMIWQVDEDLDGQVSWQQFKNMYIRCIMDDSGLEAHDLFFLTQFLMYCQHGQKTISVEDTLELIYVRIKDESEKYPSRNIDDKARLRQQIRAIFGEDQSDNRINFDHYREKMGIRMAQKRKKIEDSKKILSYLVKPS